MKAIKILLIGLASIVSTHGATLVFTNNNGVNSNAITNSAGVAYQGSAASVWVGYFTITDEEVRAATSLSTLTSGFVNFGGSTGSFTQPGPPTANNRGFFTLNAPAVAIGGSAFQGQNIYLFVQSADGNEFGVFKSTLVFDPADDPTLPNVTKLFTSENVLANGILIGALGEPVQTSNSDTVPNASFRTGVLIPEPSSVLLGAIGALTLIRRRRNS